MRSNQQSAVFDWSVIPALGGTYMELARRAKVSVRMINYIRRGDRTMTNDVLKAAQNYFTELKELRLQLIQAS